MTTLIIRFHDAALDDFSWTVSQDDESGKSAYEWFQDSESGLSYIISRNKHNVIFVIPQQCVYLTHFEFPEKASRQILSSIEYQIEDQLGEDVEQQHFAIGDASSNSVAIAVVKKAIMERCLFLQKKYNVAVEQIVPEVFLCPWQRISGEVSVIESLDDLVLRYGDYAGLKCRPQMLEAMLDLIDRDHKIQKVNFYTQHPETVETLEIEKYSDQINTVAVNKVQTPQSVLIDLRQRGFQKSSVWTGIVKAWKWIGVFLVILFSVTAFNKAIALQEMEALLADIKLNQYNVIKAHLPDGVSANDNLKNEFINVLKQRQQGQQDMDFLGQLVIFSRIKKDFSSVSIEKIGYQKNRLNIDISSTQLADIEALQNKLESSPLQVQLDNLNIRPEIISGRIRLESK